MCTIDKLGISGIRSFSIDSQEKIIFSKPVTLIVGKNGSGKTTIIECLKMACCGSLPPNCGSGAAWIHDPKWAQLKEVKASIKLLFTTKSQKQLISVRSFQALYTGKDNNIIPAAITPLGVDHNTMKIPRPPLSWTNNIFCDGSSNGGNATNTGLSNYLASSVVSNQSNTKKPSFRAMDCVLSYKLGGSIEEREAAQSCTNRVSEIDALIPQIMGVSKAIIENVIFCHQEESNWPLSEQSVLKKKFDSIFGSTKYTKALQTILNLKTELNKKANEHKTNITILGTHQGQANKLRERLEIIKSKKISLENKELFDLNEKLFKYKNLKLRNEYLIQLWRKRTDNIHKIVALLEKAENFKIDMEKRRKDEWYEVEPNGRNFETILKDLETEAKELSTTIIKRLMAQKTISQRQEIEYQKDLEIHENTILLKLREETGEIASASDLLKNRKNDRHKIWIQDFKNIYYHNHTYGNDHHHHDHDLSNDNYGITTHGTSSTDGSSKNQILHFDSEEKIKGLFKKIILSDDRLKEIFKDEKILDKNEKNEEKTFFEIDTALQNLSSKFTMVIENDYYKMFEKVESKQKLKIQTLESEKQKATEFFEGTRARYQELTRTQLSLQQEVQTYQNLNREYEENKKELTSMMMVGQSTTSDNITKTTTSGNSAVSTTGTIVIPGGTNSAVGGMATQQSVAKKKADIELEISNMKKDKHSLTFEMQQKQEKIRVLEQQSAQLTELEYLKKTMSEKEQKMLEKKDLVKRKGEEYKRILSSILSQKNSASNAIDPTNNIDKSDSLDIISLLNETGSIPNNSSFENTRGNTEGSILDLSVVGQNNSTRPSNSTILPLLEDPTECYTSIKNEYDKRNIELESSKKLLRDKEMEFNKIDSEIKILDENNKRLLYKLSNLEGEINQHFPKNFTRENLSETRKALEEEIFTLKKKQDNARNSVAILKNGATLYSGLESKSIQKGCCEFCTRKFNNEDEIEILKKNVIKMTNRITKQSNKDLETKVIDLGSQINLLELLQPKIDEYEEIIKELDSINKKKKDIIISGNGSEFSEQKISILSYFIRKIETEILGGNGILTNLIKFSDEYKEITIELEHSQRLFREKKEQLDCNNIGNNKFNALELERESLNELMEKQLQIERLIDNKQIQLNILLEEESRRKQRLIKLESQQQILIEKLNRRDDSMRKLESITIEIKNLKKKILKEEENLNKLKEECIKEKKNFDSIEKKNRQTILFLESSQRNLINKINSFKSLNKDIEMLIHKLERSSSLKKKLETAEEEMKTLQEKVKNIQKKSRIIQEDLRSQQEKQFLIEKCINYYRACIDVQKYQTELKNIEEISEIKKIWIQENKKIDQEQILSSSERIISDDSSKHHIILDNNKHHILDNNKHHLLDNNKHHLLDPYLPRDVELIFEEFARKQASSQQAGNGNNGNQQAEKQAESSSLILSLIQFHSRFLSMLQKQVQEVLERKGQVQGSLQELNSEIARLSSELSSSLYTNIDFRYKEELLQEESVKTASVDCAKYYHMLDAALMRFHRNKMSEINYSMRNLWTTVYKGKDIEWIYIASDVDDELTTNPNQLDADGVPIINQTKGGGGGRAGTRSYNYRLVMRLLNGTELDMRGRCSAGQKVLASIITRLALAESFASQCGILALDEPTTNLDQKNILSLSQMLAQLIAFKREKAMLSDDTDEDSDDEEILKMMEPNLREEKRRKKIAEKEKRRQNRPSNFQLVIITHDEQFLRMLGKEQVCDNFWRVQKDEHTGNSKISSHDMQTLQEW